MGGSQTDSSMISAGAVYVFTRAGTLWSQQAYLKASNTDLGDHFGQAVALSTDGATLAVGAHFESSIATGVGGVQTDNSASLAGAAYVFSRTGTTWTQRAYVKASNTDGGDRFGTAVGLAGDGSLLAVGAHHESSIATGIGGDATDNTATHAGAVYVY